MRKTKRIGMVDIVQLPADRGYEALQSLQSILARIGAKTIPDVLAGATPEELEGFYDQLSHGCMVDGEPLSDREDDAFVTPGEIYWFIYEAAQHNFRDIWEAECAKLDHSPEFTASETKWLPPFFAGVIVEGLASWEKIETYYSLVDIARLNEGLVVRANNEHKASKQGGSGSRTGSFQTTTHPSGGLGDAMSKAGML